MLVSGLVRGLGMFFPCRLCFFASSFGREQVRNRGAFCCSALVSSCSWNVCLLPHQGSVAGLADEFGNVETFFVCRSHGDVFFDHHLCKIFMGRCAACASRNELVLFAFGCCGQCSVIALLSHGSWIAVVHACLSLPDYHSVSDRYGSSSSL